MEQISLYNNNNDIQNNIRSESSSEESNICSICLQELQINDCISTSNNIDPTISLYKLDCEHIFHTQCYINCLKNGLLSCPLCRFSETPKWTNFISAFDEEERIKLLCLYSKRKNSSEFLKKLINKYKELKLELKKLNKEHKMFKKETRHFFKKNMKIVSAKNKLRFQITDIKEELLSIPLVPVPIKVKVKV